MFHNKSKKKAFRSAFTLIENMIAMAVIVLVIFAATNVVVSIIRNNTENVHTLVAYGLAQESLEGVRNIRDSDWLLNGRFNGKVGKNEVEIWGDSFPSVSDTAYYTIDLRTFVRSTLPAQSPSQLTETTPWILKTITKEEAESMDEKTLISSYPDENSGEVRFGHSSTPELGVGGRSTLFHRYLMIQDVSESPSGLTRLRVTGVVMWKEYGRTKELRLDTILTDWNQGQL